MQQDRLVGKKFLEINKNMKIQELKSVSSDLDKIIDPDIDQELNLNRIVFYLKKEGFEPIGRGSYSYVLEHPYLNYLLKVFKHDSGYLKFLEFCRSRNSKHLPEFIGKIMKSEKFKNFYAVRIEKLKFTNQPMMPLYDEIFNILKKQFKFNIKINQENLENIYKQILENPKTKKYSDILTLEFLKTILELFDYGFKNNLSLDLNEMNTMQRNDGTIVIIDPFFE